ncbi:response regulator, partial [Phytoactinopolyspora endophytica]|uniref:response regulator n=1 Tax=Phytoactinopolyspora endophytica TaxID=1642495 RepID=UPI001F10AD68
MNTSGGERAARTGHGDDRSIRVLLADDQDLVRAGFRVILGAETDIDVVGEASDGDQVVALAKEIEPDVILMDVQMPGTDGLEATRRILETARDSAADARDAVQAPVQVVILTTFDREDYLFEALRAGASGFLLKNAS